MADAASTAATTTTGHDLQHLQQNQPQKPGGQQPPPQENPTLIKSLSLLDPILQFLTRATGQTLVSLQSLKETLPGGTTNTGRTPNPKGKCGLERIIPVDDFLDLVRYGILQLEVVRPSIDDDDDDDDDDDAAADDDDVSWKDQVRLQWKGQSNNSNGTADDDDDDDDDGNVVAATTSPSPLWTIRIGFPSGDDDKKLCGSTKTAAKRRMAALKQRIKQEAKQKLLKMKTSTSTVNQDAISSSNNATEEDCTAKISGNAVKDWTLPSNNDGSEKLGDSGDPDILETQKDAQEALQKLLGLTLHPKQPKKNATKASSGWPLKNRKPSDSQIPTTVLPKQVSYAGSHPAQEAEYLADTTSPFSSSSQQHPLDRLHPSIRTAFLKHHGRTTATATMTTERKLYTHQAVAIDSALLGRHTIVCTGTGSGKSLCFWIPVLQRALEGKRSLLIFPTKALAQDQLIKLQSILQRQEDYDHQPMHNSNGSRKDRRFLLKDHIWAATLDGDTPHSQRGLICSTCNIILTNPDTLHCGILPNWTRQKYYQELLQELKYVVIDEAHMYEGVFGAHVAMILARLYRVHCCCRSSRVVMDDQDQEAAVRDASLVFLACSATLPHPEHHFRLLCCIPSAQSVTVVTKDTSPRGAKHFWVWNPPLLDENARSLGIVQWPKKRNNTKKAEETKTADSKKIEGAGTSKAVGEFDVPVDLSPFTNEEELKKCNFQRKDVRRRHSADETALLLARAVTQGVRCIAFCKTRCLVEWVYERCIAALKESPKTEKLVSMVDSYRGGYTKMKRREIEKKLFDNQLLGVVGTSALELGVDIGGVNLTLHCGFPSSHASLMQQAGRAGRGAAASSQPSLAICVCFNSPVDQHLHRHPSSLLSRGLSAPLSMPIYPGLVQGHLLCAGQEFPLAGKLNVCAIQSVESAPVGRLLADNDLFGGREVYEEALENLVAQGSMSEQILQVCDGTTTVFKTRPLIQNPWTMVSIRSIESINYDIVDISHPKQSGRTDGTHDEAAVLDNIPYSRVFYHAFPGAIITHRGRRYKITSMTRPPAFGAGFRSMTLGAYAKPSNLRYFTRPLSSLKITVVKQMERVDLFSSTDSSQPVQQPDALAIFSSDGADASFGSFAGCGMVTVKRNVHGYKKCSLVTRDEISRSELSLPDMEYDTFAFWIDCDLAGIGKVMGQEEFGYGVHALSHAICNVSPLFVPCVMNDVQCDHSVYNPTRVVIFDARAGGSGIVAQLWRHVFTPKGVVQAAVDLLESCPSCSDDKGYNGGCPACIQAGECLKFNDFMSKTSALVIAKHMLTRMQITDQYKRNKEALKEAEENDKSKDVVETSATSSRKRLGVNDATSPRRKKRERSLRTAKDIDHARQRQVVVGRPSWPMDRSDGPPRQQQEE